MQPIATVNSISVGFGSHGSMCCPHSMTGVMVKGSPDTYAAGLNVVRVSDLGSHAGCPHCQTNLTVQGAVMVYANGISVSRAGDAETEVCGMGNIVSGINTVLAGA